MPTGGLDVAALGAALGGGAFATTAAGALGTAALGAEVGAGLGGLEGVVTGTSPWKGALHGAEAGGLTGGGIGLGGELLGGTLGAVGADALGGAAGGALGSLATGGNVGTGALTGAASGGIAGALSPSGLPSSTPATGGPVGGGPAAPVGVSGGSGDVTLPQTTDSFLPQTTDSFTSAANAANAAPVSNDLQTLGTGASSTTPPGTPGIPSNIQPGTSPVTDSGKLPWQTGVDAGTMPANPAIKPPTSVDNFLAKPGAGTAFDVVKANPGAAISAAGLGLDVLKGNQAVKGENQINKIAGQEAAQGQQLQSYLQSGTLPPGLQAGVNQATQSAIASIKSQYASRGMSGSSAEQQDIAAAHERAQAQGAQMAMQLLNTGIQETGMSSELYKAIMGNALTQDQNLGSAISGFASAAAGGGAAGGKSIKLVQE